MATEYVEENPVDEVLYPSYDEADAALTEQYAQLGSNSQAFTEGIQSQNLSQQDQLLNELINTVPGQTSMAEAQAANETMNDILDLVTGELAIMQASHDQNILMSNNLMQNYVSSLEAGLPMLEKYVDSRIASLETRFGGSSSNSGTTTEEEPTGFGSDFTNALPTEDEIEIAESLGMSFGEAFPNRSNPIKGFDWSDPLSLLDENGVNVGINLARIYGVNEDWESATFYNPETNQLKDVYGQYQQSFQNLLAQGASLEVAHLVSVNALKSVYGPDLENIPESLDDIESFGNIVKDSVNLVNGVELSGTNVLGLADARVNFDMTSSSDYVLNDDGTKSPKAKGQAAEDLQTDDEGNPKETVDDARNRRLDIEKMKKSGEDVADRPNPVSNRMDLLDEGLEELNALELEITPSVERGKGGRYNAADSSRYGNDPNTAYRRAAPSASDSDALKTAKAFKASQDFAPGISRDKDYFRDVPMQSLINDASFEFNNAANMDRTAINAAYEAALAKKKAEEERQLLLARRQANMPTTNPAQAGQAPPSIKLDFDPLEYANFVY